MDRTERFYKIDHLPRANKCLPQKRFLQEFEVSRATFKRDIDYMRSRLHAPISWDRQGHGYCFTEPARGAPAYEPPMPGYAPRGGDIDRNGVYWVSLASGHLGKFDRSKCKVLNGPKATGKHCPEGWTLYPLSIIPTTPSSTASSSCCACRTRWDFSRSGARGASTTRTTNSTRTQYHNEGGKDNRPKVVRFQMRPDPLAR